MIAKKTAPLRNEGILIDNASYAKYIFTNTINYTLYYHVLMFPSYSFLTSSGSKDVPQGLVAAAKMNSRFSPALRTTLLDTRWRL